MNRKKVVSWLGCHLSCWVGRYISDSTNLERFVTTNVKSSVAKYFFYVEKTKFVTIIKKQLPF